MIEHTLEVYNSSDQNIGILTNARDLRYQQNLNRSGSFTFSISVHDPMSADEFLLIGQNYIKYKRNGVLRWAGQIVDTNTTLNETDEVVNVTCADWFYLLKDKFITTEEIFTGVNEGEILQDLITYLQIQPNNDMGITFGINTSVENRDRTYFDKNVQDAFVQMSEIINGLDFEITPDRVLNIFEKKTSDRSATHIFEYKQNISNVGIRNDSSQIKNDLKGYGADLLIRTRDDGGSQSAYGRRQSIESFTDVFLNSTLDRHLDEILRTNGVPIQTYVLSVMPQANPEFGSYEIGDCVRLIIKRGTVDKNIKSRIYGWNVTIDNEGVETIDLVISPVL